MSATVLKAKWIPAADFSEGRSRKLSSVILHSTCGRKQGDIPTLTEDGGPVVSCHFYVTRKGELYQFVKEEDTAYHTGKVGKVEHANAATIGIEQEHFDPDSKHPNGEDWPIEQVRVTACLCAYLRNKYGGLPILSHAEIATPKGRKADPADYPWEAFSLMVRGAMQKAWTLEVTK